MATSTYLQAGQVSMLTITAAAARTASQMSKSLYYVYRCVTHSTPNLVWGGLVMQLQLNVQVVKSTTFHKVQSTVAYVYTAEITFKEKHSFTSVAEHKHCSLSFFCCVIACTTAMYDMSTLSPLLCSSSISKCIPLLTSCYTSHK